MLHVKSARHYRRWRLCVCRKFKFVASGIVEQRRTQIEFVAGDLVEQRKENIHASRRSNGCRIPHRNRRQHAPHQFCWHWIKDSPCFRRARTNACNSNVYRERIQTAPQFERKQGAACRASPIATRQHVASDKIITLNVCSNVSHNLPFPHEICSLCKAVVA